MKTFILGLGNSIFKDDGVGLRVTDLLKELIHDENVTVESAEIPGLNMLEKLSGYDRIIVIDAMRNKGKAGDIYRFSPRDMVPTLHTGTPHDFNFVTGQIFGERIGVYLPDKIDILAVEIPEAVNFGETLSTEVEKAVPECVRMVLGMLEE